MLSVNFDCLKQIQNISKGVQQNGWSPISLYILTHVNKMEGDLVLYYFVEVSFLHWIKEETSTKHYEMKQPLHGTAIPHFLHITFTS